MSRAADALVTNSDKGKRYLVGTLRADADKVFTSLYLIPGLPEGSFAVNSGEESVRDLLRPRFLFVGRLIQGKGLRNLLEACRLLQAHGIRNWSLIIVGDGPEQAWIDSFIASHEMAERVMCTGWIENRRLASYYTATDVFIMPTLEDPWGMVVLEAMRFGKPVLCSVHAGAAEFVVEGANGYLFDPNRPDILASLMRKFVDNPALIRSMGARSRNIIAEYTPETAAQCLGEIVLSLRT